MAGSITISLADTNRPAVGVSIGGSWYTQVVDAARQYFPPNSETFIKQIYGAGDESGEDWADLIDVQEEGFNVFYQAIRKSMEKSAIAFFDSRDRPRPTPFGTETDAEIVKKLEADPRFRQKL